MAVRLTAKERQRLQKRRRQARVLFIGALVIAMAIAAASILARDGGSFWPGAGDTRDKVQMADVQEQVAALAWVDVDLLQVNDYSRPGTSLRKVNAIVVHYVGNPGTTAAQNRSFYSNLATTHETSASSNFLIGLDGEILECVPVNEVAYCSNSRNNDTISIECCHPDETGQFNDETYAALVRLTAWLCQALELDPADDIIRHYDITGKICPKYYVEHDDAWIAYKDDVRVALDALELQQEEADGLTPPLRG